jgi:hypothetical protein
MPSMTRDGHSRKADLFAVLDVHRDFAPSTPGRAVRIARFCFHFAEMCVAMLLGMMAFRMIRLGLVAHGYLALLDPKSISSSAAMGVFMTAPMVVWMRLRGCPWRDVTEMAGGMLAPWTVVVALSHLGLSEPLPWLSKSGPIATLLGMLAVMLCRPHSMRTP